MLFPNQIFSNAAKLLFGLSLFRKLIKRDEAQESEPALPEYLQYPNLAPLAKNFHQKKEKQCIP